MNTQATTVNRNCLLAILVDLVCESAALRNLPPSLRQQSAEISTRAAASEAATHLYLTLRGNPRDWLWEQVYIRCDHLVTGLMAGEPMPDPREWIELQEAMGEDDDYSLAASSWRSETLVLAWCSAGIVLIVALCAMANVMVWW